MGYIYEFLMGKFMKALKIIAWHGVNLDYLLFTFIKVW